MRGPPYSNAQRGVWRVRRVCVAAAAFSTTPVATGCGVAKLVSPDRRQQAMTREAWARVAR
eukprot:1915203-Lingulodinium_polyedra.AAC.1